MQTLPQSLRISSLRRDILSNGCPHDPDGLRFIDEKGIHLTSALQGSGLQGLTVTQPIGPDSGAKSDKLNLGGSERIL